MSADSPTQAATPSTATPLGATIPYERFLDCVHCGLCTASCPTYLETGDENNSPRGRIYLMRAVTDGRLELTDTVRGHLDLCLDCRSCESACPSGVQYGRLIEPFRVETQIRDRREGRTEPDSWFQRWILYGMFPYAGRLRMSLAPARWAQQLGLDRLAEKMGLVRLLPAKLQRMHRLLPPLKPRGAAIPHLLPAIGERRARVGLFTGCVADAMFHHLHWATARVLQANGCDVITPRGQVCCGAIHYHSGAGDPALALATANSRIFGAEDLDAVIVNVAGCGSMLKDYGHVAEEVAPGSQETAELLEGFAGRIRDVSEFLAELGPLTPPTAVPLKATYHDACHLCHAQQVRQQPRQLLSLVKGLELVPLHESEICCGAAGSYNLTQGEMADRLGRRKVENIIATGADAVIMGNVGCSLQIQAELKAAGSSIRVLHPMEILDEAYKPAKE